MSHERRAQLIEAHQGALLAHPEAQATHEVEHRLFSFISINWRAHPLTSLETVIELISHTTTEEGLQVTAIKDSQTYPTGISVTDAELGTFNIVRDAFHGEWNDTIKPQGLRHPQESGTPNGECPK